jgi:hypothetical protein
MKYRQLQLFRLISFDKKKKRYNIALGQNNFGFVYVDADEAVRKE